MVFAPSHNCNCPQNARLAKGYTIVYLNAIYSQNVLIKSVLYSFCLSFYSLVTLEECINYIHTHKTDGGAASHSYRHKRHF